MQRMRLTTAERAALATPRYITCRDCRGRGEMCTSHLVSRASSVDGSPDEYALEPCAGCAGVGSRMERPDEVEWYITILDDHDGRCPRCGQRDTPTVFDEYGAPVADCAACNRSTRLDDPGYTPARLYAYDPLDRA